MGYGTGTRWDLKKCSITEVEDDAGVMELGGASTQIAFVPEGSPLANKFPVTIGGVEYPLYVHSYLYYGQEYSFIWSVQHLVMEQPDQTTIDHPCLLTGKSSFILEAPFTNTD